MIRGMLVVLAGMGGMSVAAQEAPRALLPPPRPEAAAVRLVLGQRGGDAVASRKGLAHTAGGLVEVTQPRPDSVSVSMTGVVSVGGLPCEDSSAAITGEVCQHFRIEGQRMTEVTLEAQLSGLLRGSRAGAGTVALELAEAIVTAGDSPPLLVVAFPARVHEGDTSRFVTDRAGPVVAQLPPGDYTLTQRFVVRGHHPKKPFHKNVMTAAFGPETGRTPEWLVLLDPNRDVPRGRPLGFVVTLRVADAR